MKEKILSLSNDTRNFVRAPPSGMNNITLLFYQIEPLKNGASLILPSSIARNSSAPNAKIIFEFL